jgi:WD40 repeat protein
LRTLHGHSGTVNMSVFSHDSVWLASASSDETAKIWDPISGRCLSTFWDHNGEVIAVAFSHESKILASASSDHTIKLWDASRSSCLLTLKGHSGPVISVAFSHDSTQLASLVAGTVKVWNTRSGECLQTLECHRGPVLASRNPHDGPESSISFSHDAKQLVSISSDFTIEIWEWNSSKCLYSIHVGRPHSRVAFDESGLYLSTDIGLIAIPSPSDTNESLVATDSGSLDHHHGGSSLDGKWITYNSVNVLWLLTEYRPSCSAVSGNSIGIAVGSRVFIATLSPSSLP